MTPVSNIASATPPKSATPPGAARDGENSFGALMGKLAQHADEQAQPQAAPQGAPPPERRDTGHASVSDAPSTAQRSDAAASAKPAAPAADAAQAASGTRTAPTTPTLPVTAATLAVAARATAADGQDAADATAVPDTDATGADSAQSLSATAGPDASTTAATPPGPGATPPLTLPALIAMLMPGAALAAQAGAGDTAPAGGKASPASGASSVAGAALTAAGPPGAKSAAPGQAPADAALAAQAPSPAANLAGPTLLKPDQSDATSSTPRDKLTDAAALTSTAAPLSPPLQAATPTPDFNRLFTDAQAGVYQATLPSRPHEAAFAGDLSAEVKMLMDGGLQRAELRLNPSDLGPIQIQLSITAQTADISFHAAHSQTREGIEQALPALRDMLAAQGLSLGQAGVSSGQDQRQGSDAANAQASARAGSAGRGGPVAGSSAGVAPVQMRALRGMLDMYA
jgi:flagellar hook-length control protein FliK